MDLNERRGGENLGGVKGRGFKINYVIKKIDIQYNKAQRCNSVDRGLPSMQEAMGSISSTTQLGVVEAAESEVQGHPRLPSKSEVCLGYRRPYLLVPSQLNNKQKARGIFILSITEQL